MADNASQPDFIGYRLVIFIAFFTPLQFLVVLLRFISRRMTARPRGLDDWLVLACLVSQCVQTGISIGAIKEGGVGYHVSWLAENRPQLVTSFLKFLVAIATWYFLTNCLAKLAICVFYRTLFPQRGVLVILCITASILICTAIATTVANLAACQPFSAAWASTAVQAEKCVDKEKLYIWASFPNIVTDVVLLVLPLPITWGLHTTVKMKLALTLTFIIGSVGLISSILRFISFSNNNSFEDATWNAVELIIWTIAEPGIYLLAACLMTYRPLLDRASARLRTQAGQSKTPSQPSSSLAASRTKASAKSPATSTNRAPLSLSADDYMFSSDRGILLSSIRARDQGFERLSDPEADPEEDPALPSAGIVKTTNIRMSWEEVR